MTIYISRSKITDGSGNLIVHNSEDIVFVDEAQCCQCESNQQAVAGFMMDSDRLKADIDFYKKKLIALEKQLQRI